MLSYRTVIQKFDKQGEKTGWSYIEITRAQAQKLKPGCFVSFRVKGSIDEFKFEKTALLPMGEGTFIMPVNARIRQGTGKKAGDTVRVQLEADDRKVTIPNEFVRCLKDDPKAYSYFNSLPMGHQNYFAKWIESAKTVQTKTKRITMAVIALGQGQGYAEMIRANKGR